MKKIFFYTFLFFANFSIAQVKIGNNPISITSNKNFEVEATNGKKLNVNKDDGRMYLDNTPNALATDSVILKYTDGEIRQMSMNRFMSTINALQDLDNDGIPNGTDPDIDGDGIANASDSCPMQYGCSGTPNGCPTSCNFSQTPNNSSNGTAVITSFDDCAAASAGTLTEGTVVSAVTQSIKVTVSKAGTYNISATANGVTFIGSGILATGSQTIILTASGTPISPTTTTFTLNTTPNCSFSRVVENSTASGRIVKILTIGDKTFSTGYMNNLFNNNPTEFGPFGVVKCNGFTWDKFDNNQRATAITAANLVSTLSQYDLIIMTSSSGLSSNKWDDATETALVNYMKTKKSVFILEGDDLNTASDIYSIMGKLGIQMTNQFGGVSDTETIMDASTAAPIMGKFGDVSNTGIIFSWGQAWTFNTTRTDLVFGRVRGATSTPNTCAFWDATNYLYYTGDDDALDNKNNSVCNVDSPTSNTTCKKNNNTTTMRGARWLANLMAFAIENTPEKANAFNN